jgi:hypothetical protein
MTACAGLVGGVLSLAACGTTVPLSSVTGAGSTTGPALGDGPLGAGTGGATYAPLTPGGPGQTGSTGGATGGVTGGTTGSATGGGTTGVVPLTGRGVTATTLTIGAAIPTGTGSTGKALGISGANQVDDADMWKAVVADVNKTGGVLGRKLVLYNHSVDLASYVANPAQTFAEACADFRDDHKVFAAFVYVADPSLRKCLADMKTPFFVYGAFTMVPEAAYREHGGSYLYAPNSIANERMAKLFVQRLIARSFTEKWDTAKGGPGLAPVKLGLIHADTPDQNNLYDAYARELAKYGWKFSDVVTYAGDASTALSVTQSAVLKFSSEGITHVFGASAFFLRDAESQHYRPRYAYLPGLGALGAENAPAAQLRGALTVGWSPAQDVDEQQDPGPTAGAAHCNAVMRAAGLSHGNRQDLKLMYAVCDAVYSLRAALTAGREPSVLGLRRGYESLGSRFAPALTFHALLRPDRHYGVSSVRDMAYDSDCSCLRYTSRTERS